MKEKPSFLNNLKLKIKNIHFSIGEDADMDWYILCIFSIIAFILISSWSAYVFFTSRDIGEPSQIPTAAHTLIDKTALGKLLEKYDDRAKAYASFQGEKPQIVDPSR